MRQTYETDVDRNREAETAAAVARHYGCKLVKLPASYVLDYAAVAPNGHVRALFEIKCRKYGSKQFATGFLSLLKWQAAKPIARETGLPVFLVTRYADGVIHSADVRTLERPGVIMRRADWRGTRDAQDIEPVVEIPLSKMVELPFRLPPF